MSQTLTGLSQDSEITATKKEEKDSSRDYIVLELSGQTMWKEIKTIHASSAESAVKALGSEIKSGTKYVAVPVRNWKPVTFKIETKTTITLASG